MRVVRLGYHGNHVPREEFGGKANGLQELFKANLRVPRAIAISCDACHVRPTWEELLKLEHRLELASLNCRFSVRSGAPTSMPGLMNTALDVAYEDLYPAIVSVWDSYNSEHCKQYREDNGIPDTGTGVIIQQFVEASYSGVAFTADPTKPASELGKLNLIVEFVEGRGDKLVGGEVTPQRLVVTKDTLEDQGFLSQLGPEFQYGATHSSAMVSLVHKLSIWAANLSSGGPYDVEWCIDKDGALYYLQRRTLKLAHPASHVAIPREATLYKQGIPIGHPTMAVGVVKRWSEVKPHDRGYIVHLDEFAPESYCTMTRALAVLSTVGGVTCHAAIVGRGMKLPAISGIPGPDLWGKHALVDGHTGTVYTVPEGFCLAEQEPIAPVVKARRTVVKPKWLVPSSRIRPFYVAIRFYHALHHNLQDRINDLAETLSYYTLLTVLGELRHTLSHTCNSARRDTLLEKLKALGVSVLPTKLERELYIEQEVVPWVVKHPSPARMSRVLQLTRAVFNTLKWSSSYGGPKWGAITSHLLAYIAGEMSSELFLDGCFNLQHNGGSFFNKVPWMSFSTADERLALSTFLDTKRAAHDSLAPLKMAATSCRFDTGLGIRYIRLETLAEVAALGVFQFKDACLDTELAKLCPLEVKEPPEKELKFFDQGGLSYTAPFEMTAPSPLKWKAVPKIKLIPWPKNFNISSMVEQGGTRAKSSPAA